MIVAVFNSEEDSFQGLTAIKELNNNGDISVFATAVITKDENNKAIVKQVSDEGPIGTSIGLLTGSFIGALAGPAGLAIGAASGMFGGMFYDLEKISFDEGFVDEVSKALERGKTAVLIDVDEAWTAPLDTKMAELNAIVFRRNSSEVLDDQLTREADAINDEIDELDSELEEANDEMKASLQKQLAHAKSKNKAIKDIVDKKMKEIADESSAKTNKLKEQIESSNEQKKKKLNKRLNSIKENNQKRIEKLKVASAKASQYLA